MDSETNDNSISNSSEDLLTEEQRQFIEMCETEFANRFTETDEEYCKIQQTRMSPPIVDPWYNKPRRNYDWPAREGSGHRRNPSWRNERWQSQGGYQHPRQDHFHDRRHRPY